jgi:hypothetical protein
MNSIFDVNANEHSKAYNLIEKTANTNSFIQGAGGIIGTLATGAADIYALKIYSDLWDEIRHIYGYGEFKSGAVATLLPKLGKEIISDIAFDKVLGYIPIIGVFTNAMCAKTMTWRLGILFAFLSSRGDSLPQDEYIINAVKLIREIYPQEDMFTFSTPEKESVLNLLRGIEKKPKPVFGDKVTKALAVLSE